jgi:CRISPR-associated protein Cas5d
MFKRRAKKGQCFHQPYFGCREFPVNFSELDGSETSIKQDLELGWMLHDLDYLAKEVTPYFFKASMINGKIQVPPIDSLELMQ